MKLQANNPIKIDNNTLKKAVMTLRAINHPLRKQIMNMLEENTKLTVTEIFVKLRLEQSVVSQHLAILRKAGVLDTERDGKFIYYKLNDNRIKEIANIVNDLAQ
ncbi:MAG: metalloregulator ArsR/SmtB family transcription factor [Bacteroidota bacterium]